MPGSKDSVVSGPVDGPANQQGRGALSPGGDSPQPGGGQGTGGQGLDGNSILHKGLLVTEAASTVMGLPEPGPEKQPVTLTQVLESASSQATHKPDSVSKLSAEAAAAPILQPAQNDPAPAGSARPGLVARSFGRIRTSWQTYAANVRAKPVLLLAPPLLVFAICVALGVYGVVAGAQKNADDKRTTVQGAGEDWAASFRLSLEQSFTPLLTLAIFIQQQPYYPAFAPAFLTVTQDIIDSVQANTSIQEVQVSPMGVVTGVWPITNPIATARYGLDILNTPSLRAGSIATIAAKSLLINGPLSLVPSAYGAIVRYPIFITNVTENETFGTNKTWPSGCPNDSDCPLSILWFPAERTKFWGFVTVILYLADLYYGNDTRLNTLIEKGFAWKMTRPYVPGENRTEGEDAYVFSNSTPVFGKLPVDPISVPVNVSNAVWTVYLSPVDGWYPGWERGLVALVVLGSFVLAVLIAIIMASWAQQGRLLQDVLVSNKALAATTAHLEEEKLRLDALLVRQYNLISVLGDQAGKGGKGGADGSHMSREGLTLEKIEGMRRQLAVNSNSSASDIESIQTIELLGEGTFGKVYKGLWRGTVVAVKTMVMPANMSGAEKREKMAIMEAAISSSLSHPNIVQTYTYAIRPIMDKTRSDLDSSLVVTSDGTTMAAASMHPNSSISSTAPTNVHSYEVRLVLEYCDKGSLRDALDASVFMTDAGINYRAILDTALDVAKAMLHLHSLNVLHADLKARNIMLKSGGEGRTIMAKVADFGLSVKMDVMETHISSVFQGTLTHMAPEILLEGRVSKAADVYAFGITLWELFTGGHAFKGVPRALLGHQITREALRPRWPPAAPVGLRQLSERCWHTNPECRPTFEAVLESLMILRAAEPGDTPAVYVPVPRHSRHSSKQEILGGSGVAQEALAKLQDPNNPSGHGTGMGPPGGSTFAADLGSAAVFAPASEVASHGAGLGLGGKTTVRQRPFVLPQITEQDKEGDSSSKPLPGVNTEVSSKVPASSSLPPGISSQQLQQYQQQQQQQLRNRQSAGNDRTPAHLDVGNTVGGLSASVLCVQDASEAGSFARVL